jgi:type IV pilus assembly protein PilQ
LIEQGTELPYQTATTTGATTVSSLSFRKANLKLEVTPQITPEGEVVLEVDVNRDSVGQLTQAGYAINTKHVKTQVRVPDGGTVVLGGIYEDSDKHDSAGLPRLAQWPLLGWLFGQRQQVRRRTELLVFLTPKVLREAAAAGPQGALAPAIEPTLEPALEPALAPALKPPPAPAH